MSTAPLVLAPPAMRASLPLYEIEQNLAAYCETAEVVTPEQEEEFLQEFAAMLLQAVEKRDRMGQCLATSILKSASPTRKSSGFANAKKHTNEYAKRLKNISSV